MATPEQESPDDHKAPDKEKDLPEAFVRMLLGNKIRAQIVQHLDARPGRNRHQLAQALDVHVNTIDFHLQRLVTAGVVETRPSWRGRETLWFTAEKVGLWENPSTRVLLGRGPPRRVAEFLAKRPCTNAHDAAESLDMSVHTVRRHLRTLEEYDLIQKLRVDRTVVYHAEPILVKWLEELRESEGRPWDE